MMKIGIIGAGAMGSGIAQVAAMHGSEVLLLDAQPEAQVKAREVIASSLQKLVEKGNLTATEAKAVFGRLYLVERLESLAGCDLVIEAIVEDEHVKSDLFARLHTILGAGAILATNTSSLSITGLARHAPDPSRFIGIHFFNPPVRMPLVEIIPALQTSRAITEQCTGMIRSWNKVPVVARDTPGFIVNRIARPFYGEALRIAEERLADPQEIDAAMKIHGGFKMGPFELMDFIGHDVNYKVTQSVWAAMYYDPRYKPSHLQASLVQAGWLGRKTKRGFYEYPDGAPAPNVLATEPPRFVFDRILLMLINEAADALYTGIATAEDIELSMTLGVQYPKGLLHWADEIGLSQCVRGLDTLYDSYREDRYRCSLGLRKMAENGQTYFR